jgi:hypothetical protein
MVNDWVNTYFSEQWEDIETDIDFSKYKPISSKNSLHIHEDRYLINNKKYRLLYEIGNTENPHIQILIN